MSRVVIVLEGGLVQSVQSDDPNIEIAVLDYDAFEDIEPDLDLDNFFRPEWNPDLAALTEWQAAKTRYLTEEVRDGNGTDA